MIKLNAQDLLDLAYGAAFLGTGGGGDPYVGRLMAQQCLDEGLEINLIDPKDLADDCLVIPSAMMGAPTVLTEKISNGTEAIGALRQLERHLGREAFATIPGEIGGINSTIPLMVGARLGIPIVDADGMGRAFPELQMETFSVYGVSAGPMVVANEHGDNCLINAHSNKMLEWLSRGVTARMGGASYIALYSMSGAEVKRTAIPNTMTLAIRVGRVVREAKARHESPIEALVRLFPDTIYGYGRVIHTGKVLDVLRETREGFVYGHVQIGEPGASPMEIQFQNENLVARVDGSIRAIVPDLICIVDAETAEPITTERLRYGQRVVVMAVAVPEIMSRPEALAVWGPRSFGIDSPFLPIQTIQGGRSA